MIIKKFTGATREEAIKNARDELGPEVVVMNVRQIRPSGLFGFLKKGSWEATGALEEDKAALSGRNPSGVHFDAVAGEKGVVEKNDTPVRKMGKETVPDSSHVQDGTSSKNPPSSSRSPVSNRAGEALSSPAPEGDGRVEADLRDAFREVGDVLRKENIRTGSVRPKSEGSRILRETGAPSPAASRRPAPQVKSGLEQAASGRGTGHSPEVTEEAPESDPFSSDGGETASGRQILKTLYQVLLKNDVSERDANRVLLDTQKAIGRGANLDVLLSNVYQKMVLMLGKPHPIGLQGKKPQVVFLIGPTGVGKTTTIAKLASRFKLKDGKDVALFTADTYRIAAAEQLRTYARILSVPLEVIMEDEDINEKLRAYSEEDLILVDTTGFSHRNTAQKEAVKKLLDSVDPAFTKDVYLVLSATTRLDDLYAIIDSYKEFTDFHLIFTKLDETSVYGPIFSAKLHADKDLSYVTAGQNVPDDISVVDIQKMVRILLGGR